MEFVNSEHVSRLLACYPSEAARQLRTVRQLIIVTGEEAKIAKLVERPNGGEPSYVTKTAAQSVCAGKLKHPITIICTSSVPRSWSVHSV